MTKCEVCGKKHQYTKKVTIEYNGENLTVDEIHSPCLDELARLAVGAINKLAHKS